MIEAMNDNDQRARVLERMRVMEPVSAMCWSPHAFQDAPPNLSPEISQCHQIDSWENEGGAGEKPTDDRIAQLQVATPCSSAH